MGLTSRLKRILYRNDQPQAPAWMTWVDAVVPDTEAIRARWRDVTTAREVAKRIHGPALGCAGINARNCASVPLRMYRPATGGGKAWRQWKARPVKDVRRQLYLRDFHKVGAKAAMFAEQDDDVVEVMDHPILSMLQRPNPQEPGTEFEVGRWMAKWLFGNNVLLTLAGDGGGISGLVSLMPQYVRVQPDTERLISAYWFGRAEEEMRPFDASVCCHLKLMPHWNNPYWGMGPLDIVFRELDLYEFSLAAEQARWQNAGYPGGVLALKNAANQEQLDQARREIERQMRGAEKAGRVLVTSESTFTQLGKTNEMGYLPGMEHIERRVEQEFGVPEAMRRLNDANLASGQMGPDMYLRFTIAPALRMDAEQLSELLLPKFGIDPGEAWLAYDDVVPADLEAIRQDTTVHVAGGVLTINEQRARLGLSPVEGGDVPRINGTPLDKVGQMPAFGGIQSDFPMVGGGGSGAVRSDFPMLEAPADGGEAGVVIPEQFKRPTLAGKSWGDSDPYWHDHDHGLHTKDDDRLAASETAIREIERVVQNWLRMAAAQVAAETLHGGVSLRALEAQLATQLEPLVAQLFRAGAQDGFAQIGVSEADFFEVVPEQALQALQRHNSLIIEQIRGTTEDGIRAAIEQGLSQGLSTAQTQELVQQAVVEAAPHRAEAIARTEAANAHAMGHHEAWRSAGVAQTEWLLASGACEICQALIALSGGKADIGKPFVRAGTNLAGFVTQRDIMMEPAHPNCRCATAPVIGDEA